VSYTDLTSVGVVLWKFPGFTSTTGLTGGAHWPETFGPSGHHNHRQRMRAKGGVVRRQVVRQRQILEDKSGRRVGLAARG
jgi:hypothetical protein